MEEGHEPGHVGASGSWKRQETDARSLGDSRRHLPTPWSEPGGAPLRPVTSRMYGTNVCEAPEFVVMSCSNRSQLMLLHQALAPSSGILLSAAGQDISPRARREALNFLALP